MKKLIYSSIATCFFASITLSSCTNLDEKVYSQIPSDEFYKTEQEVVMGAGRAFSFLRWYTNLWGAYTMITNSADEACTPYREGGQWYNNKEWVNLHTHTFKTNDPQILSAYNLCFEGVAMCNQVLYQMQMSPVEFDTKDQIAAEIKILRAFFYYCATSWFGDVPIQTDFLDTSLPAQKTRKEVCDFILKEISDNIGMLEEKPAPNNYGRCTKAMADVLKAKIYLNYEKWNGEAKWDECISACNDIITDDYYSLENDYFANFQIKNETSKENIFVIPFDPVKDGGSLQWSLYLYTLHPNSMQTFGFTAICWNGIAAQEDFFKSYDADDSRIKSWAVGPQFSKNGDPVLDKNGDQLNYTPEFREIWMDNGIDGARDGDGVRCVKWEYNSSIGVNYNMDNDFTIFRYADVLMMKAEAIMRKNGKTANQDVVDLVNEVRERAFGDKSHNYTTATLTMDELLAELGREFAWEMHRRDDLIRFNEWGKPWWKKTNTGKHLEVFPIPGTVLDVNPNMKPTPGYDY